MKIFTQDPKTGERVMSPEMVKRIKDRSLELHRRALAAQQIANMKLKIKDLER